MADADCRVFVRRHDDPNSDEFREVRLEGQSLVDRALISEDATPARTDSFESHDLAREAFVRRTRDLKAAGWDEYDQPGSARGLPPVDQSVPRARLEAR